MVFQNHSDPLANAVVVIHSLSEFSVIKSKGIEDHKGGIFLSWVEFLIILMLNFVCNDHLNPERAGLFPGITFILNLTEKSIFTVNHGSS
jgi:hypothetical protein